MSPLEMLIKINAMAETRTDGLTPKEINGVKVEFDPIKKAFKVKAN